VQGLTVLSAMIASKEGMGGRILLTLFFFSFFFFWFPFLPLDQGFPSEWASRFCMWISELQGKFRIFVVHSNIMTPGVWIRPET
jgi:hypothetical protein